MGTNISIGMNKEQKEDEIKAQKQLISEMKYTLDKKDKDHPILQKTRKPFAEVYGVRVEYTIAESKKHGNTLTDPYASQTLKEKFKYFESNKIHPSLFESFDVKDFDIAGNGDFSNENSTFLIGPPNKKQPYTQPHGWTRYGLKVLGDKRYGGDAWLHPFNTDKSWYRAYHGVRGVKGEDMSVAKIIANKGFLPGRAQAYQNYKDIEGRKVGKGVYCTPDINLAACDCGGNITLKMNNGTTKKFKMVFQVCVNPSDIRIVKGSEKYWVAPNEVGLVGVNETYKYNIRPYGILLKEV